MARDDKHNSGSDETFQDQDHGAQDYEAAPDGEWNPEEPVDDFADHAAEQTLDDGAMEDEGLESKAENDEPMEDDYVHQTPEHDADYQPSAEDTVVRAREAMAMQGGAGGPLSGLMKYVPYGVAALLIAILGFFGVQQLSGSDAAVEQAASHRQQHSADSSPPENNTTTNTVHDIASDAATLMPAPDQTSPNQANDGQANHHAPSGQAVLEPVAPQQPLPAPVGQQPAAPAAMDSRIAEMSRQLEELKQNNAQLQQQLQAVPDVKALESKVAELESKLAEKSEASDRPATEASVLPQLKKDEGRDEGKPSKKTAANKKASTDFMAVKSQHNHKKKKAKTARKQDQEDRSAMPAPMPREDTSAGWVLRSAQPGVAWLSRGMSSDLRRIVPGDKVPGLGTIVSIRQEAGRWLIEGTLSSTR